ncbi:MAG: formate C-acetyltransferase [Alphaproteobacteria bacterium]
MEDTKAWAGFDGSKWKSEINVRDFIQANYSLYEGNDEFLAGPTDATTALWQECCDLFKKERANGGVVDMDTKIVSTITSHGAGYIKKELETIVGLQTDAPLKRSMQPFGGIKMAETACESYGYKVDEEVSKVFHEYRKTHNQGVFDAYTPEMRAVRKSAIITGLPDAYGRGRIIGDYRRIALYGINNLIADKKAQLKSLDGEMRPEKIQLREEISEQIRALAEMAQLGTIYGFDISKPASNAQEAIQWLYLGYLSAVKEQNGAAMSLGRTSTFLDIYIQRDLENGVITESQAQEMIDHFIMKLRLVKFARTPEYNDLFSGDPTWVTESIGGIGVDGRPLVTKNSFRYLHTLVNLGTSPEPNMTVLWSTKLPHAFKEFCARISILTSSVQYENDDIMRTSHGDDYAIACCVSSMVVGKEMQFFGARANLAKTLLYAINGGYDVVCNDQIGPKYRPITSEYLDYNEVMKRFEEMSEWLAGLYVNALNVIHYMHDKYSYERAQMALHDRDVKRYFATGIAGLSVVADSLSAIKYAKVKTIRNEEGYAVDYEVEGDFPKYGNNDDRVDSIAVDMVKSFMAKIRKHYTYRDSIPTMSILTITSNVVYGKKTGNTPDGRKKGEPLAPGANPMHGRDTNGAVASLASVAKLPFADAQDGISNTFSIIPNALGKDTVLMGDLAIDLDCGCATCVNE